MLRIKGNLPKDYLEVKDSELLESLNSNQKKAAAHKKGPCLIIAGAGTGKTTVITRKIAYLIAKKLALPSEILALTFTEKAASEMEERVDLLVPYGFVDTWITTFHAFGDKILRDWALEISLPANFKILSEVEQAIFMRENLYAFDLKYFRPVANPTAHIEELLKHFSRLKDELIAPSDYLRFAQVESEKSKVKSREEKNNARKTLELARAYQRYQDLMLQDSNLDYGDQIFLTYNLLKNNPKILRQCQLKFKYILVDEFQDTNYAQYQIVKLLAKTHQNITVVGDDDQSIYRFRGASISNILSFKNDYPKCTQIVLNQNFRSTQQILGCAYKLIQHNNPDRLEIKNKIDKHLISSKSGAMPELLHCENLSCEADRVASKIAELRKKKKYQLKDFAILARSNNSLVPFIQALNSQKIANVFVGASSLFAKSEIKMLVSFFKCLVYPDDNLAFFQLATSDLYNLDENILSEFYSLARRQNRNFEQMFAARREEGIETVLRDIKKYRSYAKNLRAGEVLYEFLNEKQFFKKLVSQNSVESEIKISNIAKFFERIAQFDHTSSDQSVHAFLNNLEMVLEVGDEVQSSDIDTDLDAVNIMTVHAAKGLEWPVVFIVNAVSERFPTRRRPEALPIPDKFIKERLPEGDYHLQEERRLFYVGATRAKDYLFLTSADDYGGKRLKKISRFVLEFLDQINLGKIKHKLTSLEKIKLHKPAPVIPAQKTPKGKQGNILHLSRQQIDDYFTCPKKFYFVSVVKVPLPTDWHFMYGSAVHETLQRYFTRKIQGQKPELDSLIIDFNTYFKNEGFITREQEEERHRSALETLARFYDEDQKTDLLPDLIEDRFEFYEDGVKVSGRYDIVINNKRETEIIDFKTSDVRDQKDADNRIRKSTQMKIYALAWFKKHHKVPKTTLFFIESNLKSSIEFKKAELEGVKEIILEAADGIKKEDYTARANAKNCIYCPFRYICPDSVI